MRIKAALAALGLAFPAAAQSPMSAINWLDEMGPNVLHGPALIEPPVADSALQPQIEVTPLEPLSPPVGLVPTRVTGLPMDLWTGSDPETLADLIANVPVHQNSAMQTLFYTLMLSEAREPADADGRVLLARLDRLMKLGATDAAQELAYLAGPERDRDLFSRWFDATLLTGNEDQSCTVLNAKPFLAPDYAARIFCAARGGDWQTAALTLEAAHALDLLTPDRLALLDRFLSPDVFDGAPPLPAPDDPDPLTFRLHEAIGERLPTSSLPRAFATTDLRDIAGWKSQLEAGERLARIGAISPNRLLGLYSDRLPAASGGVWDRVEAMQRFETALSTRNGSAVAKTLPAAWDAMQQAGTEIAFASLLGDRLAHQPLPDAKSRELAWKIRMLSPQYMLAASDAPDDRPMTRFLSALARGTPGDVNAPDETAQAIADGFAQDARVPKDIQRLIDSGERGAAILRTIDLFARGASGNPQALADAVVALRAQGLEDTARRACLQLLLLERTRS